MSIQILTTAANAVLPIVLLIFLGYFLRQLLDDPELRESLRSNAGMDAVCSNEEKYRQLMSLCE